MYSQSLFYLHVLLIALYNLDHKPNHFYINKLYENKLLFILLSYQIRDREILYDSFFKVFVTNIDFSEENYHNKFY